MNYNSTAQVVSQLGQKLSTQQPTQSQTNLSIIQLQRTKEISDKDLDYPEFIARHREITGKKATAPIVHQELSKCMKVSVESSITNDLKHLSQDSKKDRIAPLLIREQTGPRGAFEHELADGLTLQDIIDEKQRRQLPLLKLFDVARNSTQELESSREKVEIDDDSQITNEDQEDPWLTDNSTDNSQETNENLQNSAITNQQTENLRPEEETETEADNKTENSQNTNLTNDSYLAQEIANLSKVVGRLIQEIKLLKVENETLKVDNQHLRQEFQQKLSELESKLNQPGPSTSVEIMLDELLSSNISTNGKNGVAH